MEFVLLIIIMGILSSIFGKGKGKKQNRRNKPVFFETFEEMKTLVQNETKKKKTLQSESQQFQPVQQNLVEQYSQIKQEIKDYSSDRSVSRNAIKGATKIVKEEPPTLEYKGGGSFLENSDAQMVINGIIWAEILGEPRSKNPHYTRNKVR